MSRTTLCRILNVRSATVRKSIQGIDYVAAEGAKAFDDLEDIVERLGDIHGKGLTWAKDQSEKLQNAKTYFKTNYKVLYFHINEWIKSHFMLLTNRNSLSTGSHLSVINSCWSL